MFRMSSPFLAGCLIVLGVGAGGRGLAQPPSGAAADRAGIEAVVAEFVRAFDAGDAPAVAALFTPDARIETEGSPPIEGRKAIQDLFAGRFAEDPGAKIVVKSTLLRMLGPDAAVEEGTAAITAPSEGGASPPAEASRYRYTAAYVRRDGRWLQDSIHDFPDRSEEEATTPRERLRELEWLIGEWLDEDDDAEVHTTCEWAEGGAYLLRKYRVKARGAFGMSGVQRIGWDARRKQIRSWTFDSEGGFSEGSWSREPGVDRWVMKSTGALADGRSASATNILTRESRDVLRWSSVDRTLGDVALPDAESIILVRKPPAPQSAASPKPSQPAGTH